MSALPPSKSPVLAKAKAIAKLAAADHLSSGLDPSEAIAKHGADALSLSPAFRQLAVSQTNHAIFRDLRQIDKLAEYPVAMADKVEAAMGKMEKSASDMTVSTVWSRDIKHAGLTKVAVRTRDGVDIDVFGIPVDLKEPTYNMAKIAEEKLAADYWTSKQAAELEKAADFELQRLVADTKIAVCDHIRKQAMLGQDAFAVGFGLVSNLDQEKKAEGAVFVDHCVRGMIESGSLSKTAAARYDESIKTAALDFLDNATPVSRGAELTIVQLSTMLDSLDDKTPRLAGPGNRAFLGGADDRIRYKATGVFKAPQGGSSMVSRDATSLGRKLW